MSNFFTPQNISFLIISIVVICSAFFAVFSSNIRVAIFSLFFTFLGISGYYVLLFSEFLAIMQVVIYVGASLVLLLFASFLVDTKFFKGEISFKLKISSIILGILFFCFIPIQIIFSSLWNGENKAMEKTFNVTKALGRTLISEQVVALEVAGMILLLALIGAGVMLKKDTNK